MQRHAKFLGQRREALLQHDCDQTHWAAAVLFSSTRTPHHVCSMLAKNGLSQSPASWLACLTMGAPGRKGPDLQLPTTEATLIDRCNINGLHRITDASTRGQDPQTARVGAATAQTRCNSGHKRGKAGRRAGQVCLMHSHGVLIVPLENL